MADILPIEFPLPPERAIASYDWVDLAQGAGYVTLYPGDTADNKLISNGQWHSHTGFTSAADATAIDIDFDMLLNNTLTIKGRLIASIAMVGENGTVGSADVATTCTVYVRKWDGVSETEIANENGTITATGTGIDRFKYVMGSIDVEIPETTISNGESLRITIACTATANANKAIHILYNPKGIQPLFLPLVGASASDNSFIDTTTILLPLRIDL